MPTFAEMQADADRRGLVRKIKRAVGLLAPRTVELPEAITGPDKLPIDLKTAGWLPVGIVTADGWRFTRELEKEDVDALGYASPVRSDITTVPRQVVVNPLETGRKHMQELRYGVDLSGITPAVESGEIVFDEPDLPIQDEWRLLVIGSDGPAATNWIMGKGFGTVKLAGDGEEAWAKEGPVSNELTLDIFSDEELGTPVRHYLGGTAVGQYLDVLGYQEAA